MQGVTKQNFTVTFHAALWLEISAPNSDANICINHQHAWCETRLWNRSLYHFG